MVKCICKYFDVASENDRKEVLDDAEEKILCSVDKDTAKSITEKYLASKRSLCPVCTRMAYYSLASIELKDTLAQEPYGKIIVLLMGAVSHQTYMELKAVFLDESENLKHHRLVTESVWRLFFKILYRGKQPQHVGKFERDAIRSFRKDGHSMDDLAYIFDRSSQTIHHHLQ